MDKIFWKIIYYIDSAFNLRIFWGKYFIGTEISFFNHERYNKTFPNIYKKAFPELKK